MSTDVNSRFLSDRLQPIKCRVIHATSGRIRIQIPQSLKTPESEIGLKKLVEALDFVTSVRINSTTKSMIVNYNDDKTISTTAIQQKLDLAIEQATNIDKASIMAPANSNSISLTPYEHKQIQEIKRWESKEPDFLSNLAGKLFSPVNILLDILLPGAVIGAGLKAAETVTSRWQQDWEKIKQIGKIEDGYNLKQAKLEFCDRLVDKLESEAIALAGIEGGIAGLFEWVGEIADIPLSIGFSLQTIHRIGLCYGYSPETQTEKQFAWAILEIGTANTTEERNNALQVLHDLQHVLYRQTIDDTIENSVEESVFESVIDSLVKQSITNLTEEYSVTVLPLIGIGLGIIVNSLVISEVSVSARRAFQIRWLLENKKLSSPMMNWQY